MAFWADGFWADGFWADGFWAGLSGGPSANPVTAIAFVVPQFAIVTERTRFDKEVQFEDEDGEGAAPSTARWRLYCQTTDTYLNTWSTLAFDAGGLATVTIPAPFTRIINDSNLAERKVLAVEANFGTDDQVSDQWVFEVRNLQVTTT